mgnify:CR=1 FL=1
MTAPRPNTELAAVLLPDDIMLEWRAAETGWPEASLALQQETYRRFHAGGIAWMFHLGFAPESVALPETLDFWRGLAAAFARALALTPDLELVRHRVEVPADPGVLSGFLEIGRAHV